MNTAASLQRRKLDWHSFDQVIRDVEVLANVSYARCGNWDLAMICDHLAVAIDSTLDNRPLRLSLFLRVFIGPIFGPLIFRRILKTRAIPAGAKVPRKFLPTGRCPQDVAVAHLNASIERAGRFAGPLPKHSFFGRMTVEQWKDFMVVHAAHHLSFLVPQSTPVA